MTLALGDKRTCGQLGRRGKTLNTMHSTLNETRAKSLDMTYKHFYSFALRIGPMAAGSSSAHLHTHPGGSERKQLLYRWALEAGDNGTRLPME